LIYFGYGKAWQALENRTACTIRYGGVFNQRKRMKSIFVGNLSASVTEDVLRSIFEAHGSVERVSIMTDRDTGQPRGFGFVDMSNDEEALSAIAALHGNDLEGRTLNVTEARPKTDRPAQADRSKGSGFGRKRW
jgi:RNA recognition motif-containing protein